MSSYQPPTENLPIFDAGVFLNESGVLTVEYLATLFVRYPIAQSGLLTLSSTLTSGTADFNSAITLNAPPALGDNSALVPTTAWVNTAIAAGGNILPLNNQFTGTNAFAQQVTLNGATHSNRIINSVYYQLQDKSNLATTIGQIYGNSGVMIFDNDINSGSYSFAVNNSVGVQSTPFGFNATSMSVTVPLISTLSGQGTTNLQLSESTTNKYMVFNPYSNPGNLNGIVLAGDSTIIAGSNAIDINSLTLATWSGSRTGLRLTATTAQLGAGGTTGTVGTSNILFSGTSATLTGGLSISGVPLTTSTQPAFTDSSTIMPTTAWVQGAIGGSPLLKQTFNYQFFNSATTVPASTSVQMVVPFVNVSNFSWLVRLEVNYAIYANGNTTSAVDPKPLNQIVGGAGQVNTNPNTQAIIDLNFAAVARAVVAQTTSTAITAPQNYWPTNQTGPYAYTPFSIATTNSTPTAGQSTVTITIGFPPALYANAPTYQGNITAASVSIRILSSMSTTTSTPASTASTAGIAYFL